MREPCEGKLSCMVLRREGTRKGSDLSVTVGKSGNEEVIANYVKNQGTNEKYKKLYRNDPKYDQIGMF